MKKDINLKIILNSIITFNILFLIMVICYNNIIIIPNKIFINITKEYLMWYFNNPSVPNQRLMIFITEISKMIFSIFSIAQLTYITFDDKYSKIIEKKRVLLYLIVGFVVWFIHLILIKYNVEHYRLFMNLISTEILSLILLTLVLKIKKYDN